jgi:hypothetical protein
MLLRNIDYRRINHFKDTLKNIQGKTSFSLDDEQIINQLTNNLQNTEITYEYIKNQLKKNNLQNYYEYIPTILRKLNINVVDFTEEVESLLCDSFEKVLIIHNMLYSNESFLPYNYVLYQLSKYINYENLHLIKLTSYNKITYHKKWEKIYQELIRHNCF